jgi:hypothetical protein
MSEMGLSADVVRRRRDCFEVLPQLRAEADAYVARADATLMTGRDEIVASTERKQSAVVFDVSGDTLRGARIAAL